MRSYGLVAALVALAGCTVNAPVSEIDDRNAGGPPGCGLTAGFCQTVDADCQLGLAEGCTAELSGGQGLCAHNLRLCDSSGACQDDPGNFRPVSPESCDGLDDDCDGVADNGCDADGDGHCSIFARVIGHPAACAAGPVGYGDDCDDGDARRATTEICNDGVDNDCNGQVDEGCPALSLAKPGLPIVMHPGEQRVLAGRMSPDTLVPVASITASSAECDLVTAEAAISGTPGLVVTVPSVTGLDGCTYVATLEAGGVSDSVTILVEDRAPVIRYVAHARLDGGVWSTTAILEHQITLSVAADDPEGQTLSFAWSNADGLLVCSVGSSSSCTGSSAIALSVPSASLLGGKTGTDVTVTASDGTSTASATIHVAFDACVWAKSGASTTATGAEADPTGSLTDAIEAAWDASAGIVNGVDTGVPVPTDVCILGSSTFVLPETASPGQGLILDAAGKAAVHHPALLGGFADASGATAILTSTSVVPVTAANGYAGTLSDLTIEAQGAASALVVTDASPLVAGCTLTASASGTGAATLVGIDVTASTAGASPVVTGGSVRVTGGSSTSVGVRVTDTGPAVAVVTMQGLGELSVQSSSASATAVDVVAVGGAPTVRLFDSSYVRADAMGSGTDGSDAVAIDATGDAFQPSLEVARNHMIAAAGGSGTTAAIRLRGVAAAAITDNGRIAAEGQGGSVAAAILDGAATFSAGALSFTPGGSSEVVIARNDVVANEVQTESMTCAGPVVSAAILLAGSVAPKVADNGRAAILRQGYGGILGGSGILDDGAVVGTIVPVPVGLWLVDTAGAVVARNEIRAGYLASGCAGTAASFAVAYRDTGSSGASADPRTTFEANGASCAFQATAPSGVADAGCVAALVDGPSSGPGPTITNSVLSSNRGSAQVALWVRGPAVTRAYDDTFDVGALADLAQPSVREAVRLENTSAASVELVNDIFLVEGAPDAGALALRELGSTTASQLGAFEHNLLFLEGDDLATDTDPLYVRVGPSDVALTVAYPASDVDTLVSERGQGNVVGDPALVVPADPFLRFEARLSPVSAARDRGTLGDGIPAHDADGDPRPFVPAPWNGPVVPDIGHDELVY